MTTTNEPTITVDGLFGKPRQMTKDKFVQTWTNHARELQSIGMFISEEATFKAAQEFDRIHQTQSMRTTQ